MELMNKCNLRVSLSEHKWLRSCQSDDTRKLSIEFSKT